jgi:AcrR family transcriptional regulator
MVTRHTPDMRRRRADAERSIAAIVQAAATAFSERPDVNLTDVARAAGVGRVTLYAHFPTREKLLEAAVEHAVAEAVTALDTARIDDGPADEALGRLVRLAWPILDRHRGLHTAAAALHPSVLRDRHSAVLERIRRLIKRGQAERSIRTDLSADWLVTVCYSLMHGAAEAVSEGRLDRADAADALENTVSGALAPPGNRAQPSRKAR